MLGSMDWNDLRYFLAVARAGTLRGGAEAEGATHATLSRRIAALEDAMGARLFDRSRAGATLTQLGEDLLPHAERVEEEMAALHRSVAGRDAVPSGPVRLSMPPAMAVTPLMDDLAAFGRQHPEIDLVIQLSYAVSDLGRREADLSLRIAHEVTDDVVGRRLLQYSKAVYAAPSYAALAARSGRGGGLHWIGWNEPEGERSCDWVRRSPFPNAELRHRVNDPSGQAALAAAGAGLTVLPCFFGDLQPGLVRVAGIDPIPDRSMWLLLHHDLRKTARIRLCTDFIAERIRARREFWSNGTGGPPDQTSSQ
ncbi:LysR family transcriptional regulator [Oceanomicrobium pacificus]|uniref:LysR family transcriptional regulator n=1 Tax=Oceanomicrobium pacificus TaxID=2692916 RepID=A0A6B0TZI2_9RHOB|nr:LysR family transcriptional regulator [Oceanomicrobium pacificus]MXU66672.1 LysR family transcriptional regulator [Oceanomicrobium pacificus]